MKRILIFGLSVILGCLLPSSSTHAAAPPAQRQPSADECKSLGMTLAHNLSQGDFDAFLAKFDFNAMYDRVLIGIPGSDVIPKKQRASFAEAMPKSLKTALQNVTDAAFVRFEGKSGETQVLLRVDLGDEDFNYWFLTVAYTGTTTPKVVDLLTLTTGENSTETMRRMYLPLAAESNKSFFEKLSGEQSEFMKNKDEFYGFFKLVNGQKFAAALASYQRLPSSLKQNKSVQVVYLRAVSQATPEKYTDAVRQYGVLFPGDPSLAYYKYVAHRDTEKHEEALKDIDEMDKVFGPDKFFHVLRARAYLELEKVDEAKAQLQQAMSNQRRLAPAEFMYLHLLAHTGKFDELARFLREMERDNDGAEMYSLIHDDEESFGEFFKSDAFRKWMESPIKRPVNPAIRHNFASVAAKPAVPTAAPKAAATAAPVAPVPEVPKAPEPPYKLGGILYSKKSPAAIINGKTLYVGDKIKEAKVIKIEQSSVTLEIDGKTEELKLK